MTSQQGLAMTMAYKTSRLTNQQKLTMERSLEFLWNLLFKLTRCLRCQILRLLTRLCRILKMAMKICKLKRNRQPTITVNKVVLIDNWTYSYVVI